MSKRKREAEKQKKLEARQNDPKKAWKRSTAYKDGGGKGSTYQEKMERIRKGEQPRFAANPDAPVEEPEIDKHDFDIRKLFADLAADEQQTPIDPNMHHRPYRTDDQDVHLIISESFDGAGGVSFYFMDEIIPSSKHPDARTLPCFLTAEKDTNTGYWFVTRYVGHSSGDETNPSFDGKVDVIFKATTRYGYRGHDMAAALRDWCKDQPEGYKTQQENLLFGHAPKVDENTRCYSDEYTETRLMHESDVRRRDTSGRGLRRRDY